jgi:cell division protein FtsQ
MSTRQTVLKRIRQQPQLPEVPLDVRLMRSGTATLLMLLSVALILVGMWSLSRLPVFTITSISVTGDVSHNNELTIKANVTGKLKGNFFSADLEQIRDAFEAVPWVRQAKVEREFPNKLRVTLQEHEPVALWGGADDERLVNSYGEIFEANMAEVDDTKLIRLSGPDSQSKEIFQMLKTIEPTFERMRMSIHHLELSERGSWRVYLKQGARVELGRGGVDDVMPRVQRLQQTIAKITQQYGRGVSAIESADLRYDNGYAIRMRGVTTTDAASKS